MNHLAHAFLSCDDQYILTGNLITDLIPKKRVKALDSKLIQGVELHRSIDKFMDSHPLNAKIKSLIRPTQGKYASVSIDLLYDYLLVRNWSIYTDENLDRFNANCYKKLRASFSILPEDLQMKLEQMIDHDFLALYATTSKFKKVLEIMDKRAKFSSNFVEMIGEMADHILEFDQVFNEFFPLAINHISAFCDKSQTSSKKH